MSEYTCALCGKPTEGEARINDNYYCHSQDGTTCYMKANWTPTFEGRADGCYIPKRAFEWLEQVKAEAWQEGFADGVNHDLGDWENAPSIINNPYRQETDK